MSCVPLVHSLLSLFMPNVHIPCPCVAKMLLEAMDADDAMGSYDPWGTGKYKGIDIKTEDPRGPDEAGDSGVAGAEGGEGGGGGGPVAFKKRKGVGNKGKFRRKGRDEDM